VPKFALESTLSRVNHSYVFSKIIEAEEPREYGKSFLSFFVSMGPPKFIWKSKPAINADGNEFGRRIGVVTDDDFRTSIGRTYIGDLYLNFGVWGIIVGMFLLGALFRRIYMYLIVESGMSLSGVFIYSIVWLQLMRGLEDSIAPVFAGLVKILVVLIVIHFFVVAKFQEPRKADA